MWTGNDVTVCFHEQFEVICGLEQVIEDDVMTKFEVIFVLGKDDIGCSHEHI
jgi:hypothetical protein